MENKYNDDNPEYGRLLATTLIEKIAELLTNSTVEKLQPFADNFSAMLIEIDEIGIAIERGETEI